MRKSIILPLLIVAIAGCKDRVKQAISPITDTNSLLVFHSEIKTMSENDRNKNLERLRGLREEYVFQHTCSFYRAETAIYQRNIRLAKYHSAQMDIWTKKHKTVCDSIEYYHKTKYIFI
jgi:hypothetical protein